jgi:hypothetical protein
VGEDTAVIWCLLRLHDGLIFGVLDIYFGMIPELGC